MSNRVANVLDPYDFFGKSIPGIVLSVGIYSLSPGLPVQPVDGESRLTFAVLTALALVAVFTGLIVGQAVHTLADNAEKAVYVVGKFAYNSYWKRSDDGLLGDGPGSRWLARRYWGINDGLKSHRRLFQNRLGRYFDPQEDRRRSDRDDLALEEFRRCCQIALGVDVRRFDDSGTEDVESQTYGEFRQLYPVVTSTVDASAPTRAEGFQARYSFCRGMWVVLLGLAGAYTAVLFALVSLVPAALRYPPVLLDVLDPTHVGVLIGGLVVLSLVFFDASGDYKVNYIEYLINDFCEAVRNRENDLHGGREKTETARTESRVRPYN